MRNRDPQPSQKVVQPPMYRQASDVPPMQSPAIRRREEFVASSLRPSEQKICQTGLTSFPEASTLLRTYPTCFDVGRNRHVYPHRQELSR